MYNKYIKYKNKYLKLKYLIPMNGGNSLVNIPIDFDFSQINTSYELLTILLNSESKDINVLVGADNMNDDDYNRFKDNTKYSLYIDSNIDWLSKIEKKFDSSEIDKFNNMFTIYYQDLVKDIDNFPKNIIKSFDFDLMVSWFIDREDYMNIMDKLLCINGEIRFQYYIGGGSTSYISNNDNTYYNLYKTDQIQSHQYFIDSYKINIDDKNKILNIVDGFFDNQKRLSHSMYYNIISSNGIRYTYDLKDKYLIFLQTKYTNYEISLNEFTYRNYTYSLPLKLWNVPTLEYYIEKLPKKIKHSYLNKGNFLSKYIDIAYIIYYITDKDYNEYMKNNSSPVRIYKNILNDLLYDLDRPQYYYKLIKKS